MARSRLGAACRATARYGSWPSHRYDQSRAMTFLAILLSCTATDGDTIRCGRERIRLLGIDAPEMPGHCRRGRRCVAGDPRESKRSLALALRAGPITIARQGRDRYGRTLASVNAGKVNVACWQLSRRQASYKARWDSGGVTARACPRVGQ